MIALTQLPRPFIVAVITDADADTVIAEMRAALFDGADAFELNLPALARSRATDIAAIIRSVDRPVYISCRRADFMTVYGIARDRLPDWDDETRMDRQLAAIEHGAVAIDMEMDTFDPHPAPPLTSEAAASEAAHEGKPFEISHDPGAIARQREVIERAHGLGAEVILSCHTGRPQRVDQLLAIGREAIARGADLLKIVSPCRHLADLLTLLEATAAMRAELTIPFTLVGAGRAGEISRTIGVNFGSSWALGQRSFTPGGFHPQPLVAHLRETMRLIPWRLEEAHRCA
jgi:hypothetical protein